MSNRVKEELERIEIPKSLHERSKLGVQRAKLERKGSKKMRRGFTGFGGMVAGAVLAVGLIVANDPSIASSIKGFARDIFNLKGDVTGVEYHNATNELAITSDEAVVEHDKVVVPITVIMNHADQVPYKFTEALTIGDIKIVTETGEEISGEQIQVKPILEQAFSFDVGNKKLLSEVETDNPNERVFKAKVIIQKEVLNSKPFEIWIHSFYQHKKADQPLETHGEWKISTSYKP